ncbi:MAG: hypothetical protein PHX80_03905 [Candidatus Nanoarchaeia archaeon]|nr:hypothetical protein [Candidatus Nanoarchaeia archaeon]
MKLLYCPKCADIIRLMLEPKKCQCGYSSGKYIDYQNAEITNGIPIGFNNASLAHALNNRPETGDGFRFEAFVIPKKCPTIEVKGDKGSE